MTPEEAENFYEDDEDPQKIFAALDAGRQTGRTCHYIRERYGSPASAWVHKQAPGWYAAGGDLSGPGERARGVAKVNHHVT